MTIKPLNKRIIGKLEEPPKKGALILPDRPNQITLTVVSAAANDYDIKEGDKIFVNRHECIEQEIDQEKVYMIHSDRVLGIV